ncbi:hypothetical protein TNCV_1432171 [Trichonephila clavipes]|nr:hypothetical protein TNCV_1432171 [Trichonephila clavipes]
MFDPSSFANPTPLAHADASRDVLPRGGRAPVARWLCLRACLSKIFTYREAEAVPKFKSLRFREAGRNYDVV